jgi:hypothetical protein
MKKKTIIASSLLILILFTLYTFEFHRYIAKKVLTTDLKNKIYSKVLGESEWNKIQELRKLNYNINILPKTNYEFVELKKVKLDIDLRTSTHGKGGIIKQRKFFLENIDNNFIISSFNGKMQIIESLKPFKVKKLENNLPNSEIYSVLDVSIINEYIYVSASSSSNELLEDNIKDKSVAYTKGRTCQFLNVFRAKFNTKSLNFKSIFEPNSCLKDIEGGRIHKYNHNGKEGFLLTTSARETKKTLGISVLAQDDSSPFGKVLFFPLNKIVEKKSEYMIASKGHRNPQGLLVYNETILSTEHGPKGGDEINQIKFGKNYGFPIVSVGDLYTFPNKKRPDYFFKKKHEPNNFQEPIFTFVPSVGIQQLISIPNSFSKYWQDNFFVSSLYGRSLFRLRFDKKFEKIIFAERLFIGERIRDIIYDKKNDVFLLALEESGSIGILKSPQSKN